MSKIIQNLLTLSALYERHMGLSHWRVSYLVRGDGQFLKRLTAGSGCTVKTAEEVLKTFSDIWPSDLDWPSDIPRPSNKETTA